MSSSTVTYTSVYSDSEPWRFHGFFDDELEVPDAAPQSPRQAPPSPDYVLVASSDAEAPIEDQSLPVDASPTTLSPGYVVDSDLEEDLEEDHEEDPADYPVGRGDDDDDESSDDDDDDDEEEEEEEEQEASEDDDDEEEGHPALADSFVVPVLNDQLHSWSYISFFTKVQNNDEKNVFANERQHSEKHAAECVDERDALANLIANLTLDTEENKTICKELMKANAYLTQELEMCKTNLMKPLVLWGSQMIVFAFNMTLKRNAWMIFEYVKSLEKEVDELESKKADFSNIYDLLLEECVSKDVTCSYLHSLSDLNAYVELQCLYLHKVKECECLAQKLSKQTESVNKEVHNNLLKSFSKLEKHSISLELALQQCKEQMKNNSVCKENGSNVFRKEREQYHEIQDLKAQMQDKNIAISELKKLIEMFKRKGVDTNFEQPSILGKPPVQSIRNQPVVRQPTAYKSERYQCPQQRFASQVDVSNKLTKPATPHSWHQMKESSLAKPNDLIAPGPSRNCPKHVSHQSPREKVGSNDMVHNYYLEKAKISAQLQKNKDVNGKPSMIDPARLPNTANVIKKPERQIPRGHRFSNKKTTTVPEKTMNPRSCLKWKPTGRIFSNVHLRWIPTGKLLNSCTGKVDSEPAHGLIIDIPRIHACKQTLGLSAVTSAEWFTKDGATSIGVLLNNKHFRPRSSMFTRRLIAADQASVFMAMTFEQRSSSLVLHQMTSDHNRSELGIQDHSNE
ncbi:hypothetical protein Tco_0540907 [Tanacetum coccineum]